MEVKRIDKAPNFDLPGVVRIELEKEVQIQLNCIVGENVFAENPWRKVNKKVISEQIQSEEVKPEFSPFLQYKQEIIDFPNDQMLLGYIQKDLTEGKEFYFCLTLQAEKEVLKIIESIERSYNASVQNSINRLIKPWKSLGSEGDVDDNISRKSRGLLKVEYETKYPTFKNVRLTNRLADDTKGIYMEVIENPKYAKQNVYKKRIDVAVQARPVLDSHEAQTAYTYPKSMWTQYEFKYNQVENLPEKFTENFNKYVEEEMDKLYDTMIINGNINLYTSDYANLLRNKFTQKPFQKTRKEFMSFKDVKRCKDKMISALAWHPTCTGVIALAYANISPLWCKTSDDVDFMDELIHGINPVFIWSFKDELAPQLLLETSSEVHCLAFCPHDGNLLIGGCANGQIIMWEINDALQKLEANKCTIKQQKHRSIMYSIIKWKRDIMDLPILSPTAISDLSVSHISNVTSICWLHPCYNFTSIGKFMNVSDETSSQFVTSSADGIIKFWNLKQQSVPDCKSPRVLSALSFNFSQIKSFKLKPHYQINVTLPHQDTLCPITNVLIPSMPLTYEQIDGNKIYKPILTPSDEKINQNFAAGTYFGEFIMGSWEGLKEASENLDEEEEEEKEEKLYFESDAIIFNIGKYHNGPVMTVQRHPTISDVYLTVGGKVFAIWKESLQEKPVIWRKSKFKYTHGQWSMYNISELYLNRSDGNREVWNLNARTDKYLYDVAYSGKALLEGVTHPLKIKQGVIGLADYKGALRLMYTPEENHEETQLRFMTMLDNNADMKTTYFNWQQAWTSKYAVEKTRANQEIKATKLFMKELERKRKKEEQKKALQAIAIAKKMAAAKLKPPPGRRAEWADERFVAKEQKIMENILLSQKKLNKDSMLEQCAPLKHIKAEEQKKANKQKERLKKSDTIFSETIAMLFPDLVKTSEQSANDINERNEIKSKCLEAYKEIKQESDQFIKKNPYIYQFNWKHTLANCRKKKITIPNSHRLRRENEKQNVNFNK